MNLEEKVDYVRHFNRFFTRQIGVLGEGYLQSPFSLTEARILFEIAHQKEITASALGKELGLDAGYLSRTIASLEHRGFLIKKPSSQDARQRLLFLTGQGENAFKNLDQSSHNDIAAKLESMDFDTQDKLVESMKIIEKAFNQARTQNPLIVLRNPYPGDMGWVIQRHGHFYSQVYGWDQSFETLVADIVTHFLKNYNPNNERCWMAEMDGILVGSIFLVHVDDTTAKLRLFYVDPLARGRGLGTRLVEECIRFAKFCKYQKITLWTNHQLDPARHIYKKFGFNLVSVEESFQFGQPQIEETWELVL